MADTLPDIIPSERELQAHDIASTYANWSIAPSFVSPPILDVALTSGIQLRMLQKISEHYGVPFSKTLVKSILLSLLGGVLPTQYGLGALGSLLKNIPVVGGVLGFLYMPAFSWAVTYAVGKIFIQHFESGGTFLTFNPVASRAKFRELFEAAYAARKAAAPVAEEASVPTAA